MIVFGRRHPTELTLSRFADDDLPPRRLRRVGRHVERCESCRDYVRFIHELGDAARELKGHDAPDVSAIADHVIRRRRAGERVHLPDVPQWAGPGRTGPDRAATGRKTGRRRLVQAAVAGMALVVVGGGYLLFAPSAAATRGELTFEPATAGPDATVPIVYSPAYFLADEDSLRLRAEVRQRDVEAHGVRLTAEPRTATLHRDDEGLFRGTLPVEERDLFAVVAVEDFEGVDLDTNFGRLWDLYLEHENGRPTMAALEGRYRALEDYNWVMAAEWAERLIEEHPDHPLGWAARYWHLANGGTGSVADSVREFHREKLDELVRRAGSSPDPDELAWLARYAGYLDETAAHDSLLRDLTQLAPNHVDVVSRRVMQAVKELGFGSPALVNRLEEVWTSGARPTEFLVHSGVQAAAAGRADAVETWLKRGMRHPEIETTELLDDLAPYDREATWRRSLLRMRLVELEARGHAQRPLRMTSGEYESQRQAEILSLEIELAGALVESGDEPEAAALYREAAARAWRPEELRPSVDFLLAGGDTTAALPGIGLLIADPVAGDSARARYSPILEAGDVDPKSMVAASRAELGRRLLAALPLDRRLRRDTRLVSIQGEESTAGDYFAERPTVLLLWDTRFGNGSRWLTTFKDIASREWASDDGVQAAIVLPPTDHEVAAAFEAGTLPLFIDPDHGLVAQLGARAVPSFVVVNRQLEVVAGLSDALTAFRIARLLAR